MITWDTICAWKTEANVEEHRNYALRGQPWIKDPLKSDRTHPAIFGTVVFFRALLHSQWTVTRVSHSFCFQSSHPTGAAGCFNNYAKGMYKMLHEHRKRRSKFWLTLDLEKPEVLENGSFKESESFNITAVSSKYYCSQDAVLFIILYRSTGLPSCKASIIFLCSSSFSTFSTFSIFLSFPPPPLPPAPPLTSLQHREVRAWFFGLSQNHNGDGATLGHLNREGETERDHHRIRFCRGHHVCLQLLDLGWADRSCCRVNSAVIPLVSGFECFLYKTQALS